MFGNLYERALTGERCSLRHRDGRMEGLPVHSWLGGRWADTTFDDAVVAMCSGPTIDLGCGPGRLVASLVQRGVPALGVDLSPTAVGLARGSGAPALNRDLFGPLPGMGRWHTVLLADGNVGLGGDPWRVLRRAAELLHGGGRCLAEFDTAVTGVSVDWVRLESKKTIGPWFRWATVGIDAAAELAQEVGLAVAGVHPIGGRVIAALAPA
jgi:SAM-dependent methyltransferase